MGKQLKVNFLFKWKDKELINNMHHPHRDRRGKVIFYKKQEKNEKPRTHPSLTWNPLMNGGKLAKLFKKRANLGCCVGTNCLKKIFQALLWKGLHFDKTFAQFNYSHGAISLQSRNFFCNISLPIFIAQFCFNYSWHIREKMAHTL